MGKSVITPNHVYTKLGNGTIRDLTLDTNTDTVYTHPTYKVCNYAPDLSGYATIGYVDKQIASNKPKTHPSGFTYYSVATKTLQWYEMMDRETSGSITDDTLVYTFTAPSNIAAVYVYTNMYAYLYHSRNRDMVLYFNSNGVTTKMFTSSFSRQSIAEWYYSGTAQFGNYSYNAQLSSNNFSLWGDSSSSEDDSRCGGTFNIEIYY